MRKLSSMTLETAFHEGKKGKPLVIFIHGMGMNVKAWANPSEARILGGKYPLQALFPSGDTMMETSFSDLRGLAFPVLSWTQSRPSGPIQTAVNELRELIRAYAAYTGRGVIFVGHSRGGLIARKYLEENHVSVGGLITLATPHHGTTLARWAVSLSPVTSLLHQLLTGIGRREVDSALRRILGFLSSSGLRELLPDSKFFSGLSDRKEPAIRYISVGGTNPDLLDAVSPRIPELIARVFPGRIVPVEMRDGEGDGLVSAESSIWPHADKHKNFPVNHASVLFDGDVREYVMKSVVSIADSRPKNLLRKDR